MEKLDDNSLDNIVSRLHFCDVMAVLQVSRAWRTRLVDIYKSMVRELRVPTDFPDLPRSKCTLRTVDRILTAFADSNLRRLHISKISASSPSPAAGDGEASSSSTKAGNDANANGDSGQDCSSNGTNAKVQKTGPTSGGAGGPGGVSFCPKQQPNNQQIFDWPTSRTLATTFPMLKHLEVHFPFNRATMMGFVEMPALESFACSFPSHNGSSFMNQDTSHFCDWVTALPAMTHLRELRLASVKFFAPGLAGAGEFCQNLRLLEFKNVYIPDFAEFNRFLAACSALVDFALLDVTDGEDAFDVESLNPDLTSLQLRGIWMFKTIRATQTRKVFARFPRLTRLMLAHFYVQDPALTPLRADTTYQGLRELDLSKNDLTAIGVHTIAVSPCRLTRLNLSFSRILSDEILSTLAREQRGLEHLSLTGSNGQVAAAAAAGHNSAAARLTRNCLTGRFVYDLMSCCGRLQTLHLAFMPHITDLKAYLAGCADYFAFNPLASACRAPGVLLTVNVRETLAYPDPELSESPALRFTWAPTDWPFVVLSRLGDFQRSGSGLDPGGLRPICTYRYDDSSDEDGGGAHPMDGSSGWGTDQTPPGDSDGNDSDVVILD